MQNTQKNQTKISVSANPHMTFKIYLFFACEESGRGAFYSKTTLKQKLSPFHFYCNQKESTAEIICCFCVQPFIKVNYSIPKSSFHLHFNYLSFFLNHPHPFTLFIFFTDAQTHKHTHMHTHFKNCQMTMK